MKLRFEAVAGDFHFKLFHSDKLHPRRWLHPTIHRLWLKQTFAIERDVRTSEILLSFHNIGP